MLYYSVVFLLLSIVSGFFGFWGVAGVAAVISKFLFYIFLLGLVISFFIYLSNGRGPKDNTYHI